jgi:hypothetical protein
MQGGLPMCVDGDIAYFLLAIFSSCWDYVGETYQLAVKTLALAWERFQPHLQWIGPLFGIAMAARR